MLHSIRFKNFFSFRNEAEVSFRLNRHVPEDRRSFQSPAGQRLSKIMAVIGPNGAGKTNAIKPVVFLSWFITESFFAKPDEQLVFEPFFFTEDAPSDFLLEFEMEDKLYRYHLSLTRERVQYEALYRKTSKLFSYVFQRTWQPQEKNYLIRQKQFDLNQREAERVRPNASLIATAAQYQTPLAERLVKLFRHVYTNVDFIGRKPFNFGDLIEAADFFQKQSRQMIVMKKLLQNWDFGLADVVIEREKMKTEEGELAEMNIPYGVHKYRGLKRKRPFWLESSGTQGAYVLLSRILPALSEGGVVVIDELEADLHPHMLDAILELFFDEQTNPHNAQIIFTCHTMEILNILHKSQVLLVQKDDDCCSTAWRLDEMQGVRNDDNLYAKYMAGAYGAVPDL